MAGKGNAQTAEQNDDMAAEVIAVIEAKPESLRPSQRALLDMLTILENVASEDTATTRFVGDDLLGVLTAESEEEMWEGDELPGYNAKVLSGCNLVIYGVEVKFSRATDGEEISTALIGPKTRRKMYLLVHSARMDNAGTNARTYRLPDVGEDFVWNTSARYIVAKLFWLMSRGYFDDGKSIRARIHGTPLGAGKSVEKLKPLTSDVVNATAEPPF
jgi:hypothetical protein